MGDIGAACRKYCHNIVRRRWEKGAFLTVATVTVAILHAHQAGATQDSGTSSGNNSDPALTSLVTLNATFSALIILKLSSYEDENPSFPGLS